MAEGAQLLPPGFARWRAKAREFLGLPAVTYAKHVEIGLTDKSDSSRWAFGELAARGIGASLVLVAGEVVGQARDARPDDRTR